MGVRTIIKVVFGKRLSKLRAERSWSQEDLSERAEIGIKHISSLENGHREPCLGVILKLAKSFDMSVSELLRDIDE
jgi:putative transcriptional regulator